jgi:hypothetical protein
MKLKIITTSLLAASLLVSASLVLAVGGGGGGSVPTCSEDVWSCGAWSQCSSAGTQNRTCTLTYDCPSVNTPKPTEQQACTPPIQQTNPTPNDPSASTPPSSQSSGQQPTAACKKDVWSCSNWSASCDINGNQSRSCSQTFDCPGVNTPSPATSQRCDHLQCGGLPSLHDRIACRLNLAPGGIARELELQYLPEECRVMTNKQTQENCEELYKSYKPCWDIPAGQQRFDCARGVLKLGPDLSAAIATCKSLSGLQQAQCIEQQRKAVFNLIKFRFYDLEQRAEKLGERGASLQAIAVFETFIETKKQAFDQASGHEQRKQIILDVRQAWQNFINEIKDQVK